MAEVISSKSAFSFVEFEMWHPLVTHFTFMLKIKEQYEWPYGENVLLIIF